MTDSGRRSRLLGWGWWLSYPIIFQMSLTAIAAPIKLKLPPPPSRGIAGNRSAAASRDTCPTVAQPLTALVPEYRSPQPNRVWGLTGMERPTFWFYIPYPKSSIASISFTLQDESNPADTKIVHQVTIAANQNPGVMPIVLPKSSPPLAANQPYHWFLKLNMDCRSGQRPIFVDGWVQRREIVGVGVGEASRSRSVSERREASLKENRTPSGIASTPAAQIASLAENGLWYDALSTLANLRSNQPQDPKLKQDWQNLLDSIDLGYLASQPFSNEQRSSQVQRSIEADF